MALAEQCDLRGEHDDAINALSRATRLGNVEAMVRLAKRLIVGDRAPLLPVEGTSFLVEATIRGHAEAPARLAVLAASGAYAEPSLPKAWQLLTLAAGRGWRPAQSQILALAPEREIAAATQGTPAAGQWIALAETVDLTQWGVSPAPDTLSRAPLIRSFHDFLPPAVCQWLIDCSAGRLSRALVYDAVGKRDYESETRTNSWAQFDLMSSELLHLLVQLKMQAACGLPLRNMEATSVLHYAVGEQISRHFDFVSPDLPNYPQEIAMNGQRVLTFLIYLNDDYAGGETEFTKLGIVHKGRRGEGLFFKNALANDEPDLRTEHAGRPPSSGEKWIVSQFIRNRSTLGAAT